MSNTNPYDNPKVNSVAPKRKAVSSRLVAPVVLYSCKKARNDKP